MSLAGLWRGPQRVSQARKLLAPVYRRFTEGFGTADLIAAKALLASVRSARDPQNLYEVQKPTKSMSLAPAALRNPSVRKWT
jgi:predicted ATPase